MDLRDMLQSPNREGNLPLVVVRRLIVLRAGVVSSAFSEKREKPARRPAREHLGEQFANLVFGELVVERAADLPAAESQRRRMDDTRHESTRDGLATILQFDAQEGTRLMAIGEQDAETAGRDVPYAPQAWAVALAQRYGNRNSFEIAGIAEELAPLIAGRSCWVALAFGTGNQMTGVFSNGADIRTSESPRSPEATEPPYLLSIGDRRHTQFSP